jgi:hypothetical protein
LLTTTNSPKQHALTQFIHPDIVGHIDPGLKNPGFLMPRKKRKTKNLDQ